MNNFYMILAPISIGELVDKITILEIKKERITGEKFNHINNELNYLQEVFENNNLEIDKLILTTLKQVNMNLWDIENEIRIKEQKNEFDQDFINLARSVYKKNDKRASLKKEINLKYGSMLVEEKSYKC